MQNVYFGLWLCVRTLPAVFPAICLLLLSALQKYFWGCGRRIRFEQIFSWFLAIFGGVLTGNRSFCPCSCFGVVFLRLGYYA